MRAQRAKIWLERADLKPKDQWGGGMDKQIDRETNQQMDGWMSGNTPLCPTGYQAFGAAAH